MMERLKCMLRVYKYREINDFDPPTRTKVRVWKSILAPTNKCACSGIGTGYRNNQFYITPKSLTKILVPNLSV